MLIQAFFLQNNALQVKIQDTPNCNNRPLNTVQTRQLLSFNNT